MALKEFSFSGNKPFKCNHCDRAFYKEKSLTNHTSIHTGLKKHPCDVCSRKFTSFSILQQHRKTHSQHRPHQCDFCSSAFFTKNDLKIHLRTHTGEQPFLCCKCGRSFARRAHLNIHLSMKLWSLSIYVWVENIKIKFHFRISYWWKAVRMQALPQIIFTIRRLNRSRSSKCFPIEILI